MRLHANTLYVIKHPRLTIIRTLSILKARTTSLVETYWSCPKIYEDGLLRLTKRKVQCTEIDLNKLNMNPPNHRGKDKHKFLNAGKLYHLLACLSLLQNYTTI